MSLQRKRSSSPGTAAIRNDETPPKIAKRRRAIKEDEESDEMEFDGNDAYDIKKTEKKRSEKLVINNGDSVSALGGVEMVDTSASKNSRVIKTKHKSSLADTESEDDIAKKTNVNKTTKAIPKKKKTDIPAEKPTTSLLSKMPPAVPPPAVVNQSVPPSAAPRKAADMRGAKSSSSKPALNTEIKSPPVAVSSTEPSKLSSPGRAKAGLQAGERTPVLHYQRQSGPESGVLENLASLCDHYSRDIHFTLFPSAKGGIDLSGSFLRVSDGNDLANLDFFDCNENGEIILQPRPPIFPEEFPRGMTEHSLGWWGILDPALGDGKFRTEKVPDSTRPSNGETVHLNGNAVPPEPPPVRPPRDHGGPGRRPSPRNPPPDGRGPSNAPPQGYRPNEPPGRHHDRR